MLYNQKNAATSVTDSVVMGGNMRRKALLLSNGAAVGSQIFVNFGRSALDPVSGAGVGVIVHNAVPPVYLTAEQIGPSIREELHAVASAGTPTISITEFFDH